MCCGAVRFARARAMRCRHRNKLAPTATGSRRSIGSRADKCAVSAAAAASRAQKLRARPPPTPTRAGKISRASAAHVLGVADDDDAAGRPTDRPQVISFASPPLPVEAQLFLVLHMSWPPRGERQMISLAREDLPPPPKVGPRVVKGKRLRTRNRVRERAHFGRRRRLRRRPPLVRLCADGGRCAAKRFGAR